MRSASDAKLAKSDDSIDGAIFAIGMFYPWVPCSGLGFPGTAPGFLEREGNRQRRKKKKRRHNYYCCSRVHVLTTSFPVKRNSRVFTYRVSFDNQPNRPYTDDGPSLREVTIGLLVQ